MWREFDYWGQYSTTEHFRFQSAYIRGSNPQRGLQRDLVDSTQPPHQEAKSFGNSRIKDRYL